MVARKMQAAVLAMALLLPAGGAFANDWSKSHSRTKGTVIGAIAGALVGGRKGAVVGAVVGNGVQSVRHNANRHKRYYHHRVYRRYYVNRH